MTEKYDKKSCKTLADILNECLDIQNDEKCISLIAQWYNSKPNITYNENQPSIKPKDLLEFLHVKKS